MGIVYHKESKTFKLDSKSISYVISVVDEEGFLGHCYFGKKIPDSDCNYLLKINEPPFIPSKNNRDRVNFMDSFPFEYPGHGVGDFRESAIEIESKKGNFTVSPVFKSYTIQKGKPKLQGLPSFFGKENECETLSLILEDAVVGLEIQLNYTIFEELSVIVKSAKITNKSENPIKLKKALSSSISLDNEVPFDVITLHGSWAREREIVRRKSTLGIFSVGSTRGETSHQEHCFMALAAPNATQNQGEVYGMTLVYSGNFIIEESVNQFDTMGVQLGINPKDFCWNLESGESFQTPEAILAYSSEGIGGMSRSFHDAFRNHLIRSKFKNQDRPVLINSWEAMYFDFDTEKVLKLAKEAANLGIELFVLDDGWFGSRNDDNSSLGDWFVNEEKLPGGLVKISNEVHKLGMNFGLWFEPEMISPVSELYKKHPDWAISTKTRTGALARNQYVLDLTRKEIRDYIYSLILNIIKDCKIDYVKWDMNRPLSDIGSFDLPEEKQGELLHRYVLGVYELQERLVTDFPDLLLENCSSGGARFDAGMLYYSPQIWTSDNTDAISRLAIQEGTAMVFPLSCVGAHVSVCPNHLVGRNTPLETRGAVALAGTFGYELDLFKLTPEERKAVPEQIKTYHCFGALIRSGDYYRLKSYTENKDWDSWEIVSKDKKEALVTVVQVLVKPNARSRKLVLEGLNPKANYKITSLIETKSSEINEFESRVFSGALLMSAGILIPRLWGDFNSSMYYLEEV